MTQTQQELPYDRSEQFAILRLALSRLPAKSPSGLKTQARCYALNLRLVMETYILNLREGDCHRKYQDLADYCGLSLTTFRKYAAEAVALGWILKQHRTDQGGQRSNRVTVNWAAMRQSRDTVQRSGAVERQAPVAERHPGAVERQAPVAERHPIVRRIPPKESSLNSSSPSPRESSGPVLVYTGGKWAKVVRRLLDLGVIGARQAVERAKQIGARPGDVTAVIDHYESLPGAWEPRQLYQRVISTTHGSDPAENWLPFCEAYRRDEASRKDAAERARMAQEDLKRQQAAEESRRAAAERHERIWPILSGLSDDEVRGLVASIGNDVICRLLTKKLARDGPGERFRRENTMYLFPLLKDIIHA